MREKFTITKEDQKYMDSIGKSKRRYFERSNGMKITNAHNQTGHQKKNPFAESYRAKNAKVHESYAKSKALKSRVGKGTSHISGNTYNHNG